MKKPSLIIVADRGSLFAYEVDRKTRKPFPRLLQSVFFAEAHQRLSDQVTDRAGSFPVTGSGGTTNAAAERMTLVAELDTRTIRRVADEMSTILQRQRPEAWAFATPSEINGAILDHLPPAWRETLVENVTSDLIKVRPDALLDHFTSA